MRRDTDLEATLVAKYAALSDLLDERTRRRWAATESVAIGYGGDALVSAATGLAAATIRKGRKELEVGDEVPQGRVRRPGAGRPRLKDAQQGLLEALERMVDPVTRGDPSSVLRWTCKSKAKLAAALTKQCWKVSASTVGRMLHELGYSLQSVRKTTEGASHPDRNKQFEYIDAAATRFLNSGQPVISVDTKKKELIGDFRNAGKEWQSKGKPEKALVHDFPSDAIGKAIPYGIYDMARNEAYVNVGREHDTPAFAVASIRRWWTTMGRAAYPKANKLLITADAGGSNSHRARAWKAELQEFADDVDLIVHVSHFPPGTSKWNKIEHRLFCHITANWRGKPLRTFETVVQLIGHVSTAKGLRVKSKLDKRKYPKGVVTTDAKMASLALRRNAFHGDWNYELRPRPET